MLTDSSGGITGLSRIQGLCAEVSQGPCPGNAPIPRTSEVAGTQTAKRISRSPRGRSFAEKLLKGVLNASSSTSLGNFPSEACSRRRGLSDSSCPLRTSMAGTDINSYPMALREATAQVTSAAGRIAYGVLSQWGLPRTCHQWVQPGSRVYGWKCYTVEMLRASVQWPQRPACASKMRAPLLWQCLETRFAVPIGQRLQWLMSDENCPYPFLRRLGQLQETLQHPRPGIIVHLAPEHATNEHRLVVAGALSYNGNTPWWRQKASSLACRACKRACG